MPTEQEMMHAERHKAFMEGDFPGQRPGASVPAEFRMANAAEYSAYQLGQINQSLKKLVAIFEKGTK
jgi:hypothetical protein